MEPNPRFWAGKRVCITGGTGMLGYQIVEQLLRLRAQVRVLALPASYTHPIHSQSSVEKHFGDIRDQETVRQATAGCDVVFHTAGIVAVWRAGPDAMRSVHVDGTRNLLDLTARDVRVVHTSSIVTVG